MIAVVDNLWTQIPVLISNCWNFISMSGYRESAFICAGNIIGKILYRFPKFHIVSFVIEPVSF